MRVEDRGRFQAAMASMGEIFGKDLEDPVVALYWTAFSDVFIEQFEKAARTAIKHSKYFPKPGELRKWINESAMAQPQTPKIDHAPIDKWLGPVNGLFLKYLLHRRITQGYTGKIDIGVRRKACLDLADWFRGLAAENDPEATHSALKVQFHRAMDRIGDAMD